MPYKFIFSQMFDIRPLAQNGFLDFETIERVQNVLTFKKYFEPEIKFTDETEINQQILFAELETIEKIDYELKVRLARTTKYLTGKKIAVQSFDQPNIQPVFIYRNIEKSVENNFIEDFDRQDAPLTRFAEASARRAKFRTNHNFLLILAVVFLIILNGFLARPIAKQSRDFFYKILENHRISLYTSILEGGKDPLFQTNFSLITNFVKDYNVVLKFLGFQRAQKYLLIFQNNSEMRATGGFIGSYGILDLDQGKIKNFFTDDIYNIDGQLQEKIEPPKPILKVADFWSMHDANWFADFPISAQKIAWFYEKTGGPTVDGVISLTPTVIERLLKIIGPIDLPASPAGGPEYNLSISSDNFIEEMQYQIEGDSGRVSKQPKKVLIAFATKFFNKFQQLPKSSWPPIFEVLTQSLREKHILFYFRDQGLENFVLKQKWGGQLLGAAQDFLSVINSNLGGSKTDWLIEERIEHQAEIQPDGSVIDTVRIFRYHRGGKTKYEWWNKPNINYLRVYVPLGAQLINPGSNIEIFKESDKTVFAQWVSVQPGETVVTEYKYLLPFRVFRQYNLLVQKQSGSLGSQFVGRVQIQEKIWENKDTLAEDKFYEISL